MSKYLMNNWLTPTPFRSFEHEVRRLLNEQTPASFVPATDVAEFEREYRFTVSLPGVDKKDIRVEVLDDRITISGERAQRTEDEGRGHLSEITYGAFSRTFALPTPVTENGVSAKFENGMLHLTVQKSEVAKARTIEIQ